jgi:conflict system STAND superfamily ATPase
VRDCPYSGLMPFTEEQAEFFFGREDERKIIAANLMASRLTLLYGPSGVGKSSVLNAGVAHDLRAEVAESRARRGTADFALVVFRNWRDDPIRSLDFAIAQEIGRSLEGATFQDRLRSATDAINGDLMIILDQFEEYFLYRSLEDGENTFAVEFPAAVNRRDLRVSFLVSMREDSIAKLDFFKGRIPNLFDNYLRIDHLDCRQAYDAIVKPIERFNQILAPGETPITIEALLADAVLEQVSAGRVALGGAGKGRVTSSDLASSTGERVETPYLQLVMTRLWHEEVDNHSHVLRNSTLDRLGGANNIVATHLDSALEALTDAERAAAASIFQFLVTPSGTKIALGIDDLAEYAKLESDEIKPLLVRLSAGENRILTPVAPPPDRPARESYQIFHDVLAGAVLEWRNQYERTAERAASDARAEEQRLRAEHEASISARLRKQRRLLGGLLIAASALLIVVGVLGYFIFTTAGELSQLQAAFSRSDERVRQLLADAAAAQKAVVGYYEEAQRLAQEAVARAAAGDATGAKDLNIRAANASKQAETANAKVAQINSEIQKEQINSAEIRAKADALGEKLPGASPAEVLAPPPTGEKPPTANLPNTPPAENPTGAGTAAVGTPTDDPSAGLPTTPAAGRSGAVKTTPLDNRYRDTYKRAIDAKNRRRWVEARKLFEEALSQNSVESTERILISGFGNYEPYVPRYYLGLALSNLGDCQGALENWQQSETNGAVKQTNLYATLRSERAKCSAPAK